MLKLIFGLILRVVVMFTATTAAASVPRDVIKCYLSIGSNQLDAHFDYPATGADSIAFEASSWAGIDSFGVFVDSVRASGADGASLEVTVTDRHTWIVHVHKLPFSISYRVLCPAYLDSSDDQQSQFLANIGPKRLCLWGHSILLAPLNDSLGSLRVNVAVSATQGPVRCSRDLSQPLDNLEDLGESVFIGGDYDVQRNKIMGAEITLCRQGGNWSDSRETFLNAVGSILQAQARYMGIFPNQRLLIVVNRGTPNSRGGTAIPDAIVFFVDPASNLGGADYYTAQLIAHESFHLWNGRRIHPDDSKPEGYFKWFHEGITDYYSYLTIFREGIIDEGQFVEAINTMLNQYALSPLAGTADADYFAENYWTDYRLQRFAYTKGALLGFILDLTIAETSGGKSHLDHVMQSLLKSKAIAEHGYDFKLLAETIDDISQQNLRSFLERSALGTALFDIDSICSAHGLEIAHDSTLLYDLGFSTGSNGMSIGAEIVSVQAGSNAQTAGLKVGDKLIGWSYLNGEPSQTATFKLARDEVQLSISFQPARRTLVSHISNTPANRGRIKKIFER